MAKWLIIYVAVLSTIDIRSDCQSMNIIRKGKLTCQDKKKIMDLHNSLRMKVATGKEQNQPSGINVLQMNWDEELAEKAQKWADRCMFEHATHEHRKDKRFFVGQNLAGVISTSVPKSGDKPEFDNVIQEWYKENQFFREHLTVQAGHYTQLVWGSTYLIGCGYSYFAQGRNRYIKLYFCNYGPAGNILERDPYVKGRGCNKTGLTTSRKYPGLCKKKNLKNFEC